MKKSNIFSNIRNSIIVVSFVLVAFIATASNKVIPVGNAKSPALNLTENSMQKCAMNFNFAELQSIDINTQKGMFDELTIPGLYFTGKLGEPKLPAARKLIEIPFGATPKIKVVSYELKEYKLADFNITNRISPVQLPLSKSDDPTKVPFQYNEAAYSAKGYNTNELASIEVLGVLRGIRLANVSINPVEYNPSNGTIKVYNNVKIEITFEGANAKASQEMRAKTYSPYFEAIYKSIVNNRGFDYPAHPDLTKYPVKYLIISNRMFEAQLTPFIEWKTKKGFKVIVAYTDVIGTTASAIKTYIATQYNAGTTDNPAPSFCLLVGDVDKLPASFVGSESDKASDLGYFSIDGDMFPEIYYGRFSASTTAQLQPQIDKTLYYEKYQFADPTYLDNVTLIAGADGTWNPKIGQPTINYATTNYYNTTSGFATINTFLSSYTNCYNTINGNGVGLLNYTAHGSETSFADPSYSIANVNALTNANKYPLVIGNCCLTGDFNTGTCFGEAWLRAENKGAVAYIGSSPSSYWWEDFYWSVGAWNVPSSGGVSPTYAQSTWGAYDAPFKSDYVTNDAIIFIGNLAVTEAHNANYQNSVSSLYYWQAYCLFGDPSLSTYLTQGETNNVTYPAVLPIGTSTFKVNAEPHSYVAISFNGELKGVGLVDATGEITIQLDPITNAGMADIVVTKPQFKPVIQQVLVAPLSGAYVALNNFTINDQAANNNGVADYNETVKINAIAKNVGKKIANNVNAVIRSTNTYVTIIDSTYNFGNIDTNLTVTGNDAFEVKFAENTPDNQSVKFAIEFKDANDSIWKSSFTIKVNAPIFAINSFTVTENAGGNSNGRLDPGETATLKVNVKNNGNAKAVNANTRLFGNSLYLSYNPASQIIEAINVGESKDVSFTLTANAAANQGTLVDLIFDITSGHYTTDTTTVTIGQAPVVIIGGGTVQSDKYPFYNYYKSNVTQMIYLASEIGLGTKTFTHLALDIAKFTSDVSKRDLNNFKIRIIPTTKSSFTNDSVVMTGAVTVFQSANYTMPGVIGFHTFDIADFVYDGTSNLAVEISWGILSDYCSSGSEYKVNTTTVTDNRVFYRYSDTKPYTSTKYYSKNLPNIKFSIASDAPATAKNVTFIVKDENNSLLQDAIVTVGSMVKATNISGEAIFQIVNGQYDYTVSKDAYSSQSQSFTVSENDTTINVNLIIEGIELTQKTELLKIYPNPSKGVFNIVLNAGFQNTIISVYDAKGQSVYAEVVTNVSNEKSIDLSNLDKGVYIIRVVNNNKATYNKLIIE